MHAFVHRYVHRSAGTPRGQRPLELELKVAVSCLMWAKSSLHCRSSPRSSFLAIPPAVEAFKAFQPHVIGDKHAEYGFPETRSQFPEAELAWMKG